MDLSFNMQVVLEKRKIVLNQHHFIPFGIYIDGV